MRIRSFILFMVLLSAVLLGVGCDRRTEKEWTYRQIDTNSVMHDNAVIVNDGSLTASMEARYSIEQFMGKSNPPMAGTVTSRQFYSVIRDAGVPASSVIIFADDRYALPAAEWVRRDLWGGAREFLFEQGTLKYELGVNDCDDQARQIVTYAQMANARNPIKTGLPLSVGEFWYRREKPSGNHAVVACLVIDGSRLLLKFVEIDGSEISLNDREIRSCFMIRF